MLNNDCIKMNQLKTGTVGGTIILLLVFINAFILKIAFINSENGYGALMLTLPLLLAAIINDRRKKPPVVPTSSIGDQVVDRKMLETIRNTVADKAALN